MVLLNLNLVPHIAFILHSTESEQECMCMPQAKGLRDSCKCRSGSFVHSSVVNPCQSGQHFTHQRRPVGQAVVLIK